MRFNAHDRKTVADALDEVAQEVPGQTSQAQRDVEVATRRLAELLVWQRCRDVSDQIQTARETLARAKERLDDLALMAKALPDMRAEQRRQAATGRDDDLTQVVAAWRKAYDEGMVALRRDMVAKTMSRDETLRRGRLVREAAAHLRRIDHFREQVTDDLSNLHHGAVLLDIL